MNGFGSLGLASCL